MNGLGRKKLKDKRLYFVINLKSGKALLIAYGGKKEQQKIVDHIIINKDRYFRIMN